MLAKAPTLGADALLYDLEDSVPLPEKPRARELVAQAVAELGKPAGQAGPPAYVRVNALQTGLCADDVAAVARPGVAGIMLPKADSAERVREAEALLARAERSTAIDLRLALVPIVETALGLVRAFEIASAGARIVAIAFGAEDFALDMGLIRTRGADELHLARQTVAIAARAAGVGAIDMVYPWVEDEPGLIASAETGREWATGASRSSTLGRCRSSTGSWATRRRMLPGRSASSRPTRRRRPRAREPSPSTAT